MAVATTAQRDYPDQIIGAKTMIDTTQAAADAVNAAPISADLRRMPCLSEQDAGLLEQAVSMLEALEGDERNRGNCSGAEGAACSADAVRRLGVKLLAAAPSQEHATQLAGGAQTPERLRMTAGRASFFMERFLREEKLLGPNEQAALHFVIEMLAAAPAQAQEAAPLTDERIRQLENETHFHESHDWPVRFARRVEAELKRKPAL